MRHRGEIYSGPAARRPGAAGTCSATPTLPAALQAGATPAVFWPWWTLRLAPQWSVDRLARGAIPCLTLSGGTAMSIPATIARLGAAVSKHYVSLVLVRCTSEAS